MLYTGHGDAGTTTLIGSARLPKCDPRLELLGALDEAQSHLGLVRAYLAHLPSAHTLLRIQQALSTLMTELAMPGAGEGIHLLPDTALTELERDLAAWDAAGPAMTGFTIPGATIAGAHLHIARTVIRRAERYLVALHLTGEGFPCHALPYLNRLSSWVFALALRVDAPAPTQAPSAA
jgi:cob(I)alamin adenosyltransferase